MTFEELQAKYNRLIDKVRRMRGHQKEWFRYHAKVDLDASKRFAREVDQLIDQEVKQQKSGQTEMF